MARRRQQGAEWERRKDESASDMNIYIGDLPYTSDETHLRAIFEAFGTVAAARIIIDRDTGRSKGFGFVEMPNDEEGRQALQALDGATVGGRTLRVTEAQTRPASAGSGVRYAR